MRVRGGVVALSVLCAVLAAPAAPAARASVPIVGPQSRLERLAEGRRAATRTVHALRALTGTRAPVPWANGRWLVTFREASQAAAALHAPVLDGTGARDVARRVLLLDRLPRGHAPTRLAALLPGAVAVEPDRSGHRAAALPADPRLDEQWAHAQARAFEAWETTTGDDDVLVAVVDSGVWSDHPDLRGRVVEQVRTETGEVVPGRVQNDACGSGHGTSVAGVIAAAANGEGIVGVAPDVRILDVGADDVTEDCPDSGFTVAAIVAGVDWAAHRPAGRADVINLSLGGFSQTCETAFQAVVDDARAQGAVVVAAAGNEQETEPGLTQTPASCAGVLSVGATGRSGEVAAYSQRNEQVDLVAPAGGETDEGDYVLTTSLGLDLYEPVSGTSFAAPYVSGVAALLRAVDPDLSPDDVESILEATAEDVEADGRDDAGGWGLVDAAAAVARAERDGPVAPPADDPEFPVGGGDDVLPGPPTAPEAYRIDGGGDGVGEAVAVSEILFEPGEAPYAVLARADQFADALAGSGLAFGVAPLLFTSSSGGLDPRTAAELERAVEPGAAVYLLGGTAAVPRQAETDVEALGLEPVRLSGFGREATAAAVAEEIAALEIWDGDIVLLAQAGDWPDAITAGAPAAWYGLPLLLTPSDRLHAATADALASLAPERLVVLGGTGAVSAEVAAAAARAARVTEDAVTRWAGPSRAETAVVIARRFAARLLEEDLAPSSLIAVNVRHPRAFAPALAATMIAGMLHTPFVPVEGERGTVLVEEARTFARGSGHDVIGVGPTSLVADDALEALRDLSAS